MDMPNFDGNFTLPQHPLPDEIQQMKRDETVCKFCGVSYLIHNEVKILKEKLADAERQMKFYKGSVEREIQLKEKINSMDAENLKNLQTLKDQNQQLELLKSDLKMKAKLINDMYLQRQQYEKEEQRKSEKLSAHITHFISSLPHSLVKEQKECLKSLRQDVHQYQMLSKQVLISFGEDAEEMIKTLVNKKAQENGDVKKECEKLNVQLLNCENELTRLHEAEIELQAKYFDVKNKLNMHEKQVLQLEENNKGLLEKNAAFETEFIKISKQEERAKNNLKVALEEKEKECLEHEESSRKKDEELKKLNELCKSLEKLMNENSVAETKKETDKDIQLKYLEDTINEMRVQSGKLKAQREQTILAHHNRIEQLRESYGKKLEISEQTCKTLQEEIEKQKVARNKQTQQSQDCQKKIKEINQMHYRETKILQTEINSLKHKLEQECTAFRNMKEETNQLKNTLATTETRNTQEAHKYQNEILDLKMKLADIPNPQNAGELKLTKTQFEATQKSLQDAKRQIKTLEEKLTTQNGEMSVLQETVRRECEERLELTQALSNTRMQLLSCQQNDKESRPFPSSNRQSNGPKVNNNGVKTSVIATSEINASSVRNFKSTGNDEATRESVDSFRERIAAALGRGNRFNHTR